MSTKINKETSLGQSTPLRGDQKAVTSKSGIPLKPVYTPEDIAHISPEQDIGRPGEFPFTRGVHPNMYRDQVWTVRQYAGFGVGEDTNKRFRFLLDNGQTGLSMALDLPTQLGLDSDDPMAYGEIGRVGVAIDTLDDMERIFEGIPLDRISTSFTINATANILLAMYLAVAEQQGVAQSSVRGTVQNDILKEYMARGTYIFPPEPSIRLTGDTIEYCVKNVPRFNAISVSGHMQQAGADPMETLAYMFLDAQVYIDESLRRGLGIDQVAPLFSFLYSADEDFFESVARYRAARRLWARLMKDKYGAKNPKSMMWRVAGSVNCQWLVAQQPLNNIARIAWGALANVCGGVQSMLLASYDEAYAIPTEDSVRVSLMIQQMLAHETGTDKVVDPFAGSYYIEKLTDDCEKRILENMQNIENTGGMVQAVATGQIQRHMARGAYQQEKMLQTGEDVRIGVNKFVIDEDRLWYETQMHDTDPATAGRQVERLHAVKARRTESAVREALAALKADAQGDANLMLTMIQAVKVYATIGEITGTLKEVFGTYRQPGTI